MSWGTLIRAMRNELAPRAQRMTLEHDLIWREELSAWTADWLSRTWGARNLTAVILWVR